MLAKKWRSVTVKKTKKPLEYYETNQDGPPLESFEELTSIENLRELHDVLFLMKEDVMFFKMMSYMVKSSIDSLKARDELITQQRILIQKQKDIINRLENDANFVDDVDVPEDYRWD